MERKSRSVALLSAGLLVGGAAAGALVVSAANAAPADTSLTAASSGSYGEAGASAPSGEGRQGHAFRDGQGHNPDEQSVSADVEAKLKAAALKAVPGGTVLRIETDSGDAAYEAHMKKADGSLVTVKFDTSSAVTGVEAGRGKGPDGSSSAQDRHRGPHGQRGSDGSGESGPTA